MSGLGRDDDVRIAGVKVGKVSALKLDGASVKVSFTVKDAWLGDRSVAAIEVKTVLGKKYLALDPQGDVVQNPGTPIPRSRTMAPYDAFRGLSSTVDNIDLGQLSRAFDQLSGTFARTPADVRGALTGLRKLSDTIGTRDTQLRALLANTKNISQTLAGRDAEIAKLLDDGNVLLTEAGRRQQAIAALLEGTGRLSTELRGLVDDNDRQLDPVLTQLDQLTSLLQRTQEASPPASGSWRRSSGS